MPFETESFKDGFANNDLQLDPYERKPKISDEITQTIARLLGWHDTSKQYRSILSDADGRLLVSSSPTQSSAATNSQASVGVASSQLLAANPLRKQYIIQNLGSVAIYIAFGTAAIVATHFQLPAGGIFADDVWVGAIFAISTLAAQDVRIVEM